MEEEEGEEKFLVVKVLLEDSNGQVQEDDWTYRLSKMMVIFPSVMDKGDSMISEIPWFRTLGILCAFGSQDAD